MTGGIPCPNKDCDCCGACMDCGRRVHGFRPYGMCQTCLDWERRAYEIEERVAYGA